jgi:hypothetical protein
MTEIRDHLLTRRLFAAIEQQPEIGLLKNLLLKLGGTHLVAPPKRDSAVHRLIDTGFVMAGPVQFEMMEGSRCHRNVAATWIQRTHGILGIGSGYALSDDGLWRQHSWGLLREGILETTEPRWKYFGVLFQGLEGDRFAAANSRT